MEKKRVSRRTHIIRHQNTAVVTISFRSASEVESVVGLWSGSTTTKAIMLAILYQVNYHCRLLLMSHTSEIMLLILLHQKKLQF